MIHEPRHSISELWCGVCSSLNFDLDLGVILESLRDHYVAQMGAGMAQ